MLHRQSLANRKSQFPMRRSQCSSPPHSPIPLAQTKIHVLDLWPSSNVIMQTRRNLEPLNVRDRAASSSSSTLSNSPLAGTGIIITPEAAPPASNLQRHLRACRKQQFLQPITSSLSLRHEPQRLAHNPNRPRRHFQRPHSCSLIRNSACTGPCDNPSVRTASVAQRSISLHAPRPNAKASHKSSLQKMALQRISLSKIASTQALRPSASFHRHFLPECNLPQSSDPDSLPARQNLRRLQHRRTRAAPPKTPPIVSRRITPVPPKATAASARKGTKSPAAPARAQAATPPRETTVRAAPHRNTSRIRNLLRQASTAPDGCKSARALAQRRRPQPLAGRQTQNPSTRCR